MLTPALAAARARINEILDSGGKIERKDPSSKARDNPKSLRAAINGKCYECEGSGADSGWQKRIGACTLEDTCSLWQLRPYQDLA